MSQNKTEIVILAAGKGTRMHSKIPKVLHKIANKAILQHVVDTSKKITQSPIHVIFGYQGEQLINTIQDSKIKWTEQKEQLGTGHAIKQIINKINPQNDILILYGDVPLISEGTLNALIDCKKNAEVALLTAVFDNPFGYGRVVRNSSECVVKITEEKDADDSIKEINEINTGIMLVNASKLIQWVQKLENNNAQKEYYLTDIIEIAVTQQCRIHTFVTSDNNEIAGVNNQIQLSQLERAYQLAQAKLLLEKGVSLIDPTRFDIRGELTIGQDVQIDINVIIEGKCQIDDNVKIGANCILKNVVIGEGTIIKDNSMIENAIVHKFCEIGPFSRIRPDTLLADNVKVGNFVEIKKSNIASGSKINHLSYIGDTEMGSDVNIGAGTITCNYDGAYKHKTIIEDEVFIGSNSALIAPVTIEQKATIGAGSTITKNVTQETLALTRSEQVSINTWHRPKKKK